STGPHLTHTLDPHPKPGPAGLPYLTVSLGRKSPDLKSLFRRLCAKSTGGGGTTPQTPQTSLRRMEGSPSRPCPRPLHPPRSLRNSQAPDQARRPHAPPKSGTLPRHPSAPHRPASPQLGESDPARPTGSSLLR